MTVNDLLFRHCRSDINTNADHTYRNGLLQIVANDKNVFIVVMFPFNLSMRHETTVTVFQTVNNNHQNIETDEVKLATLQ